MFTYAANAQDVRSIDTGSRLGCSRPLGKKWRTIQLGRLNDHKRRGTAVGCRFERWMTPALAEPGVGCGAANYSQLFAAAGASSEERRMWPAPISCQPLGSRMTKPLEKMSKLGAPPATRTLSHVRFLAIAGWLRCKLPCDRRGGRAHSPRAAASSRGLTLGDPPPPMCRGCCRQASSHLPRAMPAPARMAIKPLILLHCGRCQAGSRHHLPPRRAAITARFPRFTFPVP
jgi:hypothetical protein